MINFLRDKNKNKIFVFVHPLYHSIKNKIKYFYFQIKLLCIIKKTNEKGEIKWELGSPNHIIKESYEILLFYFLALNIILFIKIISYINN